MIQSQSIKLFGINEWAVRLPTVLFAIGIMIVMILFFRKSGFEDLGWLSAFIFVT